MFWDTVAGQEFTKYTIPELINSMNKMVEELNNLKNHIISMWLHANANHRKLMIF